MKEMATSDQKHPFPWGIDCFRILIWMSLLDEATVAAQGQMVVSGNRFDIADHSGGEYLFGGLYRVCP